MIGHTGIMQLPPRAYGLCWSKPDTTLFNFLTLAGRAKKQPSCDYCFSSNHDSTHCPEAFFQNPLGSLSMQLLPQMLMPHAATASNQQVRPICGLFNSRKGCSYAARCKYVHICTMCKGNHPRFECLQPQAKRFKSIKDQ